MNAPVTVAAGEFKAGVGWAAKVTPRAPIVPIHACLALSVRDGMLTIEAYDEDVTARATVAVEGLAEDSPRVVVSARLLAALAGTFDARKPVTLAEDGGKLVVTAGSWRGTLPTMPAEDFPALPAILTAVTAVNGDALAAAVKRVVVAVDPTAALAACRTMWLGVAGGTLTLVGCDRYRAATAAVPLSRPGVDAEMPVAGHALEEAAAAFAGSGEVTIGCDGNTMSLTSPTRAMTLRMTAVEGGYPVEQFRNYLAAEQPESVTVAPGDFLGPEGPLKRASIVAGKGSPVRVTIGAGLVTIAAGTDSEGAEEIDADYAGEETLIGFNPDFLGDALATAPGPKVRIGFGDPKRPVTVSCEDDPTWRHILVPVRLLG